MKKRWIAIALLTVLLMGIGGAIGKVGVRQESGGSAYALYFVERDLRSADGGDALRSEERTLEDSGLSTEELAAALMTELLKGPADPTLKSPFPKGTALLSAEQKGTERPSEEEKRFCDDQCERFGHGDGEPDAVDAEKFWQKKYRGDLNDERAQERNERAGCAIVEPREKRRTEDIETADEE